MSNENIISKIYKAYQKAVPSPFVQSTILGGLTVPAVYLANRFMYNRLKRLAQDPRAAALAGLTPQQAVESLEQFQNSTFSKHVVPWLAGAAMFGLSLAPNVRLSAKNFGIDRWYPGSEQAQNRRLAAKIGDVDQQGVPQSFPSQEQLEMPKDAALKKYASMWGDQGYQPVFDFDTPLTQRTAVDLFANNPYIKEQDYQRNLGTSIIMAAPTYGGQTTLGNVYDSAVNKFQKKLSLSGLAGSAIKGAVAGGLAGMFTDTLGAVVGMPDPLRRSVANTVGFAKAMCTILS